MYNPLISVGVGLVVAVLLSFVLGGVLYGIVPGILVSIGVFIWLSRKAYARMSDAVQKAQDLMQPPKGFNPMAPGARSWKPPFDEAIAVLEACLPLAKWQPLISEQVSGQIGQLYYLQKKYDQAAPHLERAWSRDWMAKAFLGAHLCRTRKAKEMKTVFEATLRVHDKEPFLWNMYAWCLHHVDDSAGAILALDRAAQLVPSDERTATNLQSVRNGKKVNMKPFGDMWYLFFLEEPQQVMVQQQHMAFGRGGRSTAPIPRRR